MKRAQSQPVWLHKISISLIWFKQQAITFTSI